VPSRLVDLGWVVWASARMQAQDLRGNKMVWIPTIVQPAVLFVITFGALAPARPRTADQVGTADSTSLMVGVLLMALWGATIWTAGGVMRRELLQGTLAANFAGVRPPQLVLLGKCFGSAGGATLVIVATVVVAAMIQRAPIRLSHPVGVSIGLLVAVASATTLGMLMSTLFVLTRHGHHLSSLMMYPVYLLGGLLIPTDVLPEVFRWPAALVGLRWAGDFLVHAARGSIDVVALTAAVGLTVAYLFLAGIAFSAVSAAARRRGTLDL
jgi:ABC-2 type transport system permease protein